MSARPTWAEVNLTALQHNFRTVHDFVRPNATVCCVVKCDAYGHGAVECSLALQREGATWFGVTSVEEAVKLRRAGVSGRILVMTGFWRGEEDEVLAQELTPAIWSWEHLEALENAAVRQKQNGRKIPVHLKLDTGMARLGLPLAELDSFADALREAEHVVLDGVFSHLASSEVLDAPDAVQQIARFDAAVEELRAKGFSPQFIHMANSAAVVGRPGVWHNMVRPGLLLYGDCLPTTSIMTGAPEASMELPLVPVMSWKTRIIALRDVPAGQAIGYSGAFVTSVPSRIAVIPVGYGDGYSRHLSSRGRVLVRGDYASIVGNVSMDLTTIDVTGMPGVSIGDEVVLMGSQGEKKISVWEHAQHAMTIPYEVLCGLSPRVPRMYVEE